MSRKHWSLAGRIALALIIIFVFSVGLSFNEEAEAQGYSQTHTVQSGENLFRIALRYGTSVDAIADVNNIVDGTTIYVGQVLNIPDSTYVPGSETDSNPSPATVTTETTTTTSPVPAAAPIYHIVERGQTLYSIATQYGIQWTELAAWNNLGDANTIYSGQRLVVNNVAAPDSAAVAGPTITEAQPVADTTTTTETTAPTVTSQTVHTVARGDHLASIARSYGVSWTSIANANNLSNPNTIYAGQQLVIPASSGATGTYFEPNGGVPSAPAPTQSTGKEIIVKLSEQRVYAYENGQLLKAVTVSTGLPSTPTVTGSYRIYWKLASQTMSGPGYYLPGVPYVMYFYQGYALHGTYWHNNFGQPMSHGCVNMTTNDAQWFFNWAQVGTPVTVNY